MRSSSASPQIKSDRARILMELNRFAQSHYKVLFDDLCRRSSGKTYPFRIIDPLLPAVTFNLDRS